MLESPLQNSMIETFEVKKPRRYLWYLVGGFAGVLLILIVTFLWWQTRPSANFPIGEAIVVPKGHSASEVASLMKERSVIKSELLFYLTVVWKHDPNLIQAGTYVFDEPLNMFNVAERLVTQGTTENLVSLTLPEGYSNAEFAALADKVLLNFSTEEFISKTSDREGYLFPDTYYVTQDLPTTELIELLTETFEVKLSALRVEMRQYPLTEKEIIILASILEREANSEQSMRMISDILQKRLAENMRLQVDAAMEYVLEKPLQELRPEDLEIDSPYNTYLYAGLPPTPIGNPGLMSIEAVLNPIENDYYYYITDEDGNFYYAKTFDEHRENIALYLK